MLDRLLGKKVLKFRAELPPIALPPAPVPKKVGQLAKVVVPPINEVCAMKSQAIAINEDALIDKMKTIATKDAMSTFISTELEPHSIAVNQWATDCVTANPKCVGISKMISLMSNAPASAFNGNLGLGFPAIYSLYDNTFEKSGCDPNLVAKVLPVRKKGKN